MNLNWVRSEKRSSIPRIPPGSALCNHSSLFNSRNGEIAENCRKSHHVRKKSPIAVPNCTIDVHSPSRGCFPLVILLITCVSALTIFLICILYPLNCRFAFAWLCVCVSLSKFHVHNWHVMITMWDAKCAGCVVNMWFEYVIIHIICCGHSHIT